MKSLGAVEIIAHTLKKVVDEAKHEGEIVIYMNAHCGGIRSVIIDVSEKKTSRFEFSGAEKIN